MCFECLIKALIKSYKDKQLTVFVCVFLTWLIVFVYLNQMNTALEHIFSLSLCAPDSDFYSFACKQD